MSVKEQIAGWSVQSPPISSSALSLSDDGKLLVATDIGAHIFTLGFGIRTNSLLRSRTYALVRAQTSEALSKDAVGTLVNTGAPKSGTRRNWRGSESFLVENELVIDRVFNSAEDDSPAMDCLRQAVWSPLGLAQCGSCVLALVTLHGVVQLFAPPDQQSLYWKKVCSLQSSLLSWSQANQFQFPQNGPLTPVDGNSVGHFDKASVLSVFKLKHRLDLVTTEVVAWSSSFDLCLDKSNHSTQPVATEADGTPVKRLEGNCAVLVTAQRTGLLLFWLVCQRSGQDPDVRLAYSHNSGIERPSSVVWKRQKPSKNTHVLAVGYRDGRVIVLHVEITVASGAPLLCVTSSSAVHVETDSVCAQHLQWLREGDTSTLLAVGKNDAVLLMNVQNNQMLQATSEFIPTVHTGQISGLCSTVDGRALVSSCTQTGVCMMQFGRDNERRQTQLCAPRSDTLWNGSATVSKHGALLFVCCCLPFLLPMHRGKQNGNPVEVFVIISLADAVERFLSWMKRPPALLSDCFDVLQALRHYLGWSPVSSWPPALSALVQCGFEKLSLSSLKLVRLLLVSSLSSFKAEKPEDKGSEARLALVREVEDLLLSRMSAEIVRCWAPDRVSDVRNDQCQTSVLLSADNLLRYCTSSPHLVRLAQKVYTHFGEDFFSLLCSQLLANAPSSHKAVLDMVQWPAREKCFFCKDSVGNSGWRQATCAAGHANDRCISTGLLSLKVVMCPNCLLPDHQREANVLLLCPLCDSIRG